jgi:hypothetical protein
MSGADTLQGVLRLDKAFVLIEGHPGFVESHPGRKIARSKSFDCIGHKKRDLFAQKDIQDRALKMTEKGQLCSAADWYNSSESFLRRRF